VLQLGGAIAPRARGPRAPVREQPDALTKKPLLEALGPGIPPPWGGRRRWSGTCLPERHDPRCPPRASRRAQLAGRRFDRGWRLLGLGGARSTSATPSTRFSAGWSKRTATRGRAVDPEPVASRGRSVEW